MLDCYGQRVEEIVKLTRSLKIVPLCCAVFCTYGAASVYAQTLPSSADPSRELNTPKAKVPEFQQAQPQQLPTQTSSVNAPAGSEKVFFDLKSITLEGMTAYSKADMEKIYAADVGHKISVYRLFEIMNAIQSKYLKDGYALTRVTMPDQDIADGNVTFTVIEGYAAEVTLDPAFEKSAVLDDAVAHIKAMRPLNTKQLEKLLLTINDLPGLNASAVLASLEGPPVVGGVRLILKKNDEKTYAAILSANNHGSRFSGPTQLVASGRKANVLSPFDELSATLSAAIPMTEMRYVGVKYQRPIWGAHGLNLALEGSMGRTVPGASLKALDVKGQSQSAKVTLSYSPIRQRDETLELKTSFEARQSKTDFSGFELYDDRLRIVSLGATYNMADQYDGMNAFELTYSQGLNLFGVREAGSPDLSRADGKPDFHKIYASVGRLQALPMQFEFLGIVQGQYAFEPLLASEEFGFGGGQIGRGYDPSEITGDKGMALSLELRRNVTLYNANFALQPYAFYDIGQVWNIDPSAKDRISGASTGIGIRVGTAYGWSGDINLAVPLTKNPDNPPKYTNGNSPRILISVQKAF